MRRVCVGWVCAVLAMVMAVPAVAAEPENDAPATEIAYDDLVGVWGYDFDHLAGRDDLAALGDSGHMQYILEFLGRVTWEFTPDRVMYVRASGTLEYPLARAAISGNQLTTNIEHAQGAVPSTVRLIDEHTLVCGFPELREHPSLRFTRLYAPGDEVIGRWSGTQAESKVSLIVSRSGRAIYRHGENRSSGQAQWDATDGGVTLTIGESVRMTMTFNDSMSEAEVREGDRAPMTLTRSFDPLGWIEGVWNIDPTATREHPFYQRVWPEALRLEPPTQEPVTALTVEDGKHSGQFPLDVYGVSGSTVLLGAQSGHERAIIPLRRLGDNGLETLVEKLVLRRVSVLERNIQRGEHGDHDH